MKNNPKSKSDVFSEKQYSDVYPDGMEKHYWILSRNRIVEAQLRKYVSAEETILDIGAGCGITVKWLRQKGFNCYGCEPGLPKIVADIKSRVFVSQDAFSLPLNFRSRVKAILMLDVLEHIKDPGPFLKKCRSEFPNLNTMLITVPAGPKLWSNYDEYYGHYRRYDLDSLKELLKISGFRLTDSGYFFHLLYVPARLLTKFVKKRSAHLLPPSLPIIHSLIASALYLETFIIPKSWLGTSLLAVAS